jgi:uncharacterized protein (DUF169 family)
MLWKKYATALTEALKLKDHIVGITYTNDHVEGADGEGSRACTALMKAHQGKSVLLGKENSLCGGGTWHLGLGDRPSGEGGKALMDFLVHGEKLACSYAAFHRMTARTSPPPKNVADYILFAPMDEMELEPDIAVLVVNAEQACSLLTLYTYFTGKAPVTEMMGSGCHMAIAYSISTGEMNVSFSDWTARPIMQMAKDELLVTVPYYMLHNMVEAIPRCTAGTAEGRPYTEFMQEHPAGSE